MKDELIPSILFREVGMACVARYSVDEKWYRAQVMERIDNYTFRVRYSDYGNEELRQIHDIKMIEEELIKLPPLAYHCQLSVLRPDVTWNSNDKIRFAGFFESLENGFFKVVTLFWFLTIYGVIVIYLYFRSDW